MSEGEQQQEKELNETLILSSSVSKINRSSTVLSNGQVLCHHCNHEYDHSAFLKHQKNCKRKKSNVESSKNETSSLKRPAVQDVISLMDEQERITKLPSLEEDCERFRIAAEHPERRHWIGSNLGIPRNVMFQFYKKHVDSSLKYLRIVIPEIKLEELKRIRGVNWQEVIRQPNEIFHKVLIEKRIETFDEQKKYSIKNALNKFYKERNYPIEPFQLRKIKKVESETENRYTLLPLEFITVLESLIKTKIRAFCHIAADLMLIYQSGLRFPSSFASIVSKITELMQQKPKDRKYIFHIISTKTKKRVTISIDAQLIELLQLLEWKGFCMEESFYTRLSRYLPFTLITMRRGFYDFLYLTRSPVHDLKAYTGHKSEKNALIYAKSAILDEMVALKTYLRLRFLNTNNKVVMTNYAELSLPKYAIMYKVNLEINWEETYLPKINSLLTEEQQKMEFDLCEPKVVKTTILITPPAGIIEQEKEINEDMELESSSEEEQELKVVDNRSITVGINRFSFIDNKIEENFVVMVALECEECEKIEKCLKCLLCGLVLCNNCKSTEFRFGYCACCEIYKPEKKPMMVSNKKAVLRDKITLNKKYIHEVEPENFVTIKKIILAREFAFTNVSVNHEHVKIPDIDDCGTLNLKYYDTYVNYKYFPPIRAEIYGDETKEGVGFGIFATEDIEKGTFIGEYAADVVNKFQLRYARRRDMCFNLYESKKNSQSLFLSPIKYCGYVPLINNLEREKLNNCKSIITCIDNRLRVLIYAGKMISKGEQLGYYYGDDFEIEEEVQVKSIFHLKFPNKGNTCYINAVIQAISYIAKTHGLIFKKKKKNFKKAIKFALDGKIDQLIELLNSKSVFIKNKQQDAQDFLTYLENYIDLPITIVWKKTLICSNCERKEQMNETTQAIFVENEVTNPVLNFSISETVEARCEHCLRENKEMTTEISAIGSGFFIYLKRFEFEHNVCQKINKKMNLPPILFYQNEEYIKKFEIRHIGNHLETGHYTIYDFENSVEVNDNFYIANAPLAPQKSYLVFYEKKNMENDKNERRESSEEEEDEEEMDIEEEITEKIKKKG